MSQMVNVNFRLEDEVKKSVEDVCTELGLSMSAACFVTLPMRHTYILPIQ